MRIRYNGGTVNQPLQVYAMHPQLQKLHQDHVNLSKVLNMLEALLADVQAGEHVNLDMLSEIVDYVQSYPDQFHHRQEDVIFSIYLGHSACRNDLMEQLMTEHTLLINKSHELGEKITQWRNDSPVPRERVVAIIADYLKMQRDHLNVEESSVFDVLDRELTPADWERVEAAMPALSDPLFGDPMRQRFENILERLIA